MMTPAATLRKCLPEDAQMLSAIAQRTFYDTFTGTCTEDDMDGFLELYYNVARMRAELETDVLKTWFAEKDGEVVGYISFARRDVPFTIPEGARPVELIRLYIDKQYHGRGIAQELTDFYIAWAEEQTCNYLWLGVWEHNIRAQKFYRKYGFSPTGYRHPFPIGLTPQMDEWWAREL